MEVNSVDNKVLKESYFVLVDIRNILVEILKQLTPEEEVKLEIVEREITKSDFITGKIVIDVLSKSQEWLQLREWSALVSLARGGSQIFKGARYSNEFITSEFLYIIGIDYLEEEEKVVFHGQVMEEQALKERIKIEGLYS